VPYLAELVPFEAVGHRIACTHRTGIAVYGRRGSAANVHQGAATGSGGSGAEHGVRRPAAVCRPQLTGRCGRSKAQAKATGRRKHRGKRFGRCLPESRSYTSILPRAEPTMSLCCAVSHSVPKSFGRAGASSAHRVLLVPVGLPAALLRLVLRRRGIGRGFACDPTGIKNAAASTPSRCISAVACTGERTGVGQRGCGGSSCVCAWGRRRARDT
jgi:hypothetical protein